MRRWSVLFAGILFLVSAARSDDGIPPDTVVTVKRATVFIRVDSPDGKGTGSGFVISATKDTVLIATNYHVIGPSDFDKKPRVAPAEFVKSLKVPAVTVVFDGGTKTELSAKAEVIAGDPVNDLAVLRVTGLKTPPKPIDYATPSKPTETMAVYSFGYPFGESLATGKGAPAVTVGKASVSSLRLDEDGELSKVQIDGALNPGNSGGPVVDTKGKLVGVVVSGVRNSGIGFAVPAQEVGKIMKGRLDGFHLTANKGGDGKLVVKADVGVLDPTGAVRGGTLHYVVVPPKGAKPKAGEPIAKLPGAKSVPLKIAGGVATGELNIEKPEGDLYVQAVPAGGAGAAGMSRVGDYALAMPKAAGAVVLGPAGTAAPGAGAGEVPAPPGWKEHTTSNKSILCWVPVKVKSQHESSRTSGTPQVRVTSSRLIVDAGATEPTYMVEQVTIITNPRKQLDRKELTALLHDTVLDDVPGGKMTRELDTAMGRFPGKEYLVEKGKGAVRARTFIIGSSFYIIRAMGTREQVDAGPCTTFLDSVRLQTAKRPVAKGPDAGGKGPDVGGVPPKTVAAAPVIAGGRTDAVFSDPVPVGGTLVGLEVGVGKLGPNSAVKGARAIFRVGDKEVPGTWHGPTGTDVVTEKVRVVAKAGYAVGGLNVRTGAGVFGLSVTFMKEANGKLDPNDAYESDWVGAAVGLGPIKVGSTGEVARGFAGKKNAATVSGVGLLYGDTGKQEPGKVAVAPAPAPDKMPPMGPDVGIAAAAPAAVRPGERGPRIQGGGFDSECRDHAPADGVLVGFHVGLGKFFNNDTVKAIRPIYRVGEKDSNGNAYGNSPVGLVKVLAKPGYAVAGVTLKTGLGIDGMSVTFMKIVDGKLDPTDAYQSEWIGGKGGGGEVKIGGDGALVVGVLLKVNAQNVNSVSVNGLGLVYSDTNKPGLDGPWPAGISTKLQGGGGDPEFREVGPDGSLLVGLEVGVGRFFDNPVVATVRPVFRAGGVDTEGEWHGTPKEGAVKEVVKVVAKPGYAVGAITVKTGLGIDGLSVTFAKVVDGKLNPRDTYESEWVGGKGGGGPVKIGGDGALVIGLTGKARADGTSGLGLLLPPPKKK